MNTSKTAYFIAVQSGVPTYIVGEPGSGKTQTTYALARALKRHMVTKIGNQCDPADIGGYPYPTVNGDNTHYMAFLAPSFAHDIVKAHREGVESLLFLDELTTCAPAVQAAMLRTISEGVVGDTTLPATCWRVAAGNPPEQAANGFDLAAPMANRLCHLQWESDPLAWCDAALAGFPDPTPPIVPADFTKLVPGQLSLVSSFVRKMPSLLQNYPKSLTEASGPWPSSRSWTNMATIQAAAASVEAAADVRETLTRGCVGEAAALAYHKWLVELDLPDPELLLQSPATFQLPKRGDKQYAVLGSVAAAVLANCTPDRWHAGIEIMSTAAATAPDIAFLPSSLLTRRERLPAGVTIADVPDTLLDKFHDLLAASGSF